MTEQDYIDVTNLAKLRTMQTILRDVLAMRPNEEALQAEVSKPLATWVAYLEKYGAKIKPEQHS